RNTSLSQRSRPVRRPRQRTWQEAPWSVAVVTKTRSPWTIGDERPSPGRAVFQATFSVALHRSGRSAPAYSPCPVGPRNRGQSPAPSAEGRGAISSRTHQRGSRVIVCPCLLRVAGEPERSLSALPATASRVWGSSGGTLRRRDALRPS